MTTIVQPPRKRRRHLPGGGIKPDHRADHEHVAVREVNELKHAVHHRVADGDQRVDRSNGQTVDELLNELGHAKCAKRPATAKLQQFSPAESTRRT